MSVILETESVNFSWEDDIDWARSGSLVSENLALLDHLEELCNKAVCAIMTGKDTVGEISLYGDAVCVLLIFMLPNVLVISLAILESVLSCM